MSQRQSSEYSVSLVVTYSFAQVLETSKACFVSSLRPVATIYCYLMASCVWTGSSYLDAPMQSS